MAAQHWLTATVEALRTDKDAYLIPYAEKLAGEPALAPLWAKFEAECAKENPFFSTAGDFFRSLTLQVSIGLRQPAGYKAMTPALMDAWRQKTQKIALDLLAALGEGYPEIYEKEDDAYLAGGWATAAALNIATQGKYQSIEDLAPMIESGALDNKRFAFAYSITSRPQLILTHLIEWLDHDAAVGHTMTQAASKNAHRNSFIRQLTQYFELYLKSPMRAHVFSIASLFFDMGALGTEDIKKIAPAGAAGLHPQTFLENDPG